MSRRAQSIPPEFSEKPPRSRCLKIICVSWKVLTCIISHVALISLVVGYCLGGAYLFQHLELDHEIAVKKGIKEKRLNVTDYVWEMSENMEVLIEKDWIENVEARLRDFETVILMAMKTEGWDGDENIATVQWTFEGSLFYSIIVITTIGYGHIAPRTQYGKVTTIFYAILGIPLMLLCLSNIGDIMASSFRFLYWRVCCFVCTREPKRRRNRFSTRSRQSIRQTRSQPPPQSAALRRSIRTSQRSADSGFVTSYDHAGGMYHAYSDPELRYSNFEPPVRGRGGSTDIYSNRNRDRDREFNDNYEIQREQTNRNKQQSQQRFSNRTRNRERMRERHTIEREGNLSRRPQFDSTEDIHIPAKRAQSSRSVRATSVGRDINRVYSQTLPSPTHQRSRSNPNTPKIRAKSVDARATSVAPRYDEVDDEVARKTPILCNRYAIDELDRRQSTINSNRRKRNSLEEPRSPARLERRHSGSPRNRDRDPQYISRQPPSYQQPHYGRYGNQLDIPNRLPPAEISRNRYSDRDRERDYHNAKYSRNTRGYDDDYYDDEFDEVFEMQTIRKDRRPRRAAATSSLPPSPRIMSPMGFAVNRQAKLRQFADDDSYYDDEIDSYGNLSPDNRPVPIWLCVFLVVSYIIAGAFIFRSQEGWSFLDATYFCFITLTTIGFGDFVPSTNNDNNPRTSIALCSLYLLFGISLLAMSFNLVQEEVIANVKEVARRLGILKEQEPLDD